MADNEDFESDELDEGSEEQSRNPGREYQRQLERDKKALKAENAEKDTKIAEGLAAQKELAFLRAGVDTTKGAGKLLLKSYEGDLTAEAIKAVAEEYDLVPTSEKAEVKEEIQGLREVSQASSGSSGSVAPTVFDQIKEAGRTGDPEAVIAIARKLGVTISDETPGEFVSLV